MAEEEGRPPESRPVNLSDREPNGSVRAGSFLTEEQRGRIFLPDGRLRFSPSVEELRAMPTTADVLTHRDDSDRYHVVTRTLPPSRIIATVAPRRRASRRHRAAGSRRSRPPGRRADEEPDPASRRAEVAA